MRIHTRLSKSDIRAAARVAGVTFARFHTHGSRKSARAFDVILEGSSNRRGNSSLDYQAATWDEWGIFLAAVFEGDPNTNATYYTNADDFHWQTGDRFRTLQWSDQHRNHKWNWNGDCVTGSYSVHECKCGALMRRGNYQDAAALSR